MPDTVARLNAALQGRYRVEQALGEGGTVTGPRHLIRTPALLGLLVARRPVPPSFDMESKEDAISPSRPR